ncbi:rhamnogalacturonan acetylesterase [Nesterenkonia sp. F]|uniref:rhamnogalacturonan acetylesterase n=1 Tax=Nesterenkonia sp. F TaxID=795955 RepID=UPI000255CFD8|nr:rhamnogalacturonan acetylesterase [Nesterenkonia sp. F]
MDEQTAVTRRTALGALAAGAGAVGLAGCVPQGTTADDAGTAGHASGDTTRGDTAGDESAGRPRRLVIAGDSTAAEKPEYLHPMAGWGMALPFYTTSRLRVENRAQNGRSSKSFIAEGHLARIAEDLGGDDVLVIQFGHNDEIVGDPRRSTEPWSTFQQMLREHLEVARAAGAEPVLATPTERRRVVDGELVATHGQYPEAVRAVAEEQGIALLDLQRRTLERWRQLGPEESSRCFVSRDGQQDPTHFSVRGAGVVARMVAEGLLDLGVVRSTAFRRLHRTPAEEDLSWDLEEL